MTHQKEFAMMQEELEEFQEIVATNFKIDPGKRQA